MSIGYAQKFFQNKGWSPVQSAAIAGNLFGESGLNTQAVGDGGQARGIAQWHPDRQATFARVNGTHIGNSSLDQQLGFVDWELNNTEKRAGGMLRQQTTLAGATAAFMKGYERPANNSSFGGRLKAAGSALANGNSLLSVGAKALGLDDKTSGIIGSIGGTAAEIGASFIPGGSAIIGGLGLGADSCGWLCQFQNWIKDSGFFQRLALAFLAFIMLASAFYMMKSSVITGAKEGLTP